MGEKKCSIIQLAIVACYMCVFIITLDFCFKMNE